jgi:maleate isomerase
MHHFGVLIPSTNTTVEIEYSRLLPASLQVHVGRLLSSGTGPFAPSRDDDIDYQAKLLGTAKVEVISLAQTSASLFADDYDANVTQRMSAAANCPAITSAQAVGQSVQALGARRIALVSPYSAPVIERARHYYESKFGLEVVALEGFAAADSHMIGKLGPENARDAFARDSHARHPADPGSRSPAASAPSRPSPGSRSDCPRPSPPRSSNTCHAVAECCPPTPADWPSPAPSVRGESATAD